MKIISKLHKIHLKSLNLNENLTILLDNLETDPINGTSKVAIEINSLESLASQISDLNHLQKEKSVLISSLSKFLEPFCTFPIKSLKLTLTELRSSFKSQITSMKSDFRRLSIILKEYKERCKSTVIYHLKNLDHDIRKILKPLVPSDVLKQQVNFPSINKNPSLQSSVTSSIPSSPTGRSTDIPSQQSGDKQASHTELLVNTLEKVAKDLIAVLVEVNAQYFDFIRDKPKLTNPPTPLAAPLPEYFIYETEESDIPITSKLIIKEDAQSWIKRFNNLYSKGIIDGKVYIELIDKVNPLKLRGCRIDLQDIFKDVDLDEEQKENITFALVNKSEIKANDVSLSELLEPEERKNFVPEPPKEAKMYKQRAGIAKFHKKSFEFDRKNDQIFNSVDFRTDTEGIRASPVPKFKITSDREKGMRKSQGSDKREKSSRARSITPVFLNKDRGIFGSRAKKMIRKG